MSKKFLFCLVGLMFVFTGCSDTKKLSDYVEVNFSGTDTMGTANYSFDETKLVKDIFGYDGEIDFADEKKLEEIDTFLKAFKIKLDKTEDLSNGDKVKVIVSVDTIQTNKIKSGEKIVEVQGLEEPKRLTSMEVEKNLVINFTGADGRGSAQIDNVFSDFIGNIEFQIKDNGNLKNGDQATIEVTDELEKELNYYGYILDENFDPKFEVKNLVTIAKNAKEITNFEDITRMIDESVKRKYQDIVPELSYGTKYEIVLEKLFYRQFNDRNNSSDFANSFNHFSDNGTLIGIYTVKEYSGGTENKLIRQHTAIHGYSGIILDDNNNTNVTEISELRDSKDDTYSLESVLKLYEGYGYEEVT